MMHKDIDNFISRIRNVLTLPIPTRCAELTVLLDRGSILDLQTVFPLLIDNIFGPQGSVSWGLRSLRSANEDVHQLTHFLSPCGTFFKLIYTLLKDPSTKYDFPIAYLPTKVQQILENYQAHPFYADLVHVNPQTKHVISLLLNPFDYYIFHFAYHLINPWHQRSAAPTTFPTLPSWNTVYFALSCTYMSHFLPADPAVIIYPLIYYNGKSPVHPLQQATRSMPGSKLINTNVLNKSMEEYTLHQNFGRHPRNQIWRSETVLTVFVDMWLSNDQISQNNQAINTSGFPRLLQYNELPSAEYMRIVRSLIKMLHAFSSSAKRDDTHMCELKKIAIPMVQGKFYVFLRNLIHRWPLDGSFRLVLELWLTYLQPWRYSTAVTQNDLQRQSEEDMNVMSQAILERDYLPFIAENLLVYVVIFQQLLPRFTRVDLVSPKMSMMLYRISKVFSQPNLAAFLQEIENCIDSNHSPSHSFNSHWLSSLPPLNPTSNWCTNTSSNTSNNIFNTSESSFRKLGSPTTTFMNSLFGEKRWCVIVKQRIYELEGPAFVYKPLFSSPPAPEVFELLIQIKRSIRVSQELIQAIQAQNRDQSFFSLFKIWECPQTDDEFSVTERMKVPAYLEASLENLSDLFQITNVPDIDNETPAPANNGVEMSNDFRFLTPSKVRERIKKIKYEGDPDLHPIRSSEVTVLVRMFYQFALYINDKYKAKIFEMYYNQNFLGRLSRQVLSPPITIYRYDKNQPGSPRVSMNLPPRVSFRSFARYSFLSGICLGGFIAVSLGYSISLYLVIIMFFYLFIKIVKAITSPPVSHGYPTQGFGNISFNDSF